MKEVLSKLPTNEFVRLTEMAMLLALAGFSIACVTDMEVSISKTGIKISKKLSYVECP